MAFNVNTFKSFMPDIVSAANFYVTITNPRCLDRADYSLSKLSYLCETAAIPGIRVATDRVNRYNLSGTSYLVPYAGILEDTIPFTFYIPNDDPLPIKAFNFWMQQIVGVPNSTLLNPGAGVGLIPGQVRYRDEYTTEIIIHSLDRSSGRIIETTLYGAYPTSYVQIDLNWANEDIVRLQSQITFSGIRTVTYSLSGNVWKEDRGVGTPDVKNEVYSAQLNKIRDELNSAKPAPSLNSITQTARDIRDAADGFFNKLGGGLDSLRQITQTVNEVQGAIVGVRTKANGVVNDYKDALNRIKLP
jgi:hypothetical protein